MKKLIVSTGLVLGILFVLNSQSTGIKSLSETRNDFEVSVRVYLEGSLIWNEGDQGSSHSRPLMRDNLRVSPYNSKRYIPDSDPYATMDATSWDGGKKKYQHVLSGLEDGFNTIENPEEVFSVEGENAITDWVFVELRSKLDKTVVIATRSGLVQRDGDVVDLDGVSKLSFPGVEEDDYYVVVRHRNHLGAMTAEAKTPQQLSELIDFTQASTGFFDFGDTRFEGKFDYDGMAQNPNVYDGYLTLWGGDFNGDGKIKYSSPNDDLNYLLNDVVGYEILDDNGEIVEYNYFTNYDLAYGYHFGDFNMDSKVRFVNPIDDRNMVYATVLFNQLNPTYDVAFDFFIEQIPE